MKLQELHIQGYKNLKDAAKVSFDFTKCTNYTALIGLNGSGKSNILEAVSLIFSSLYHNTTTDFSYAISYTFEDSLVTVNKLFEEFIYAYIEFAVLSSKVGVQEYIIARARKRKSALLRNAKIRISNIHPGRLLQNLRGRDKWLK